MEFGLFVSQTLLGFHRVPQSSIKFSALLGLQELHVDLSLGHSHAHQVGLAEERIVRSTLIEHTGLSVGHTEWSSLQQLSLGVGVDSSSRSESLFGGDLEHTGELDGELALLGLLRNTKGTRQHHTIVNEHTVLVRHTVLQNHEIAHSTLAKIIRERSRCQTDHVGRRGHRNIQRGRHRAEHQTEFANDLVLVEHGERGRGQNAHIDLLREEHRPSVLDDARRSERDIVLLPIEVNHHSVHRVLTGVREHHHHVLEVEVVQIHVVMRHGPRQILPSSDLNRIALDRAQHHRHSREIERRVEQTAGSGDNEVVRVHASHLVELIAVTHMRLRLQDHLSVGSNALQLSLRHIEIHVALIDQSYRGVGQIINVGILIFVHSVHLRGDTELEVHAQPFVLQSHNHSQRQQLVRTDNDERFAIHRHHFTHSTHLSRRSCGKISLSQLHLVVIKGSKEGGDTSIEHSQRHKVVQLSQLHIVHAVGNGMFSNVAVNSSSSTRPSISSAINAHRHSRLEVGDVLKEWEIIAVHLVLDLLLNVSILVEKQTALQNPRLTQEKIKAKRTRIIEI